MYRAYSLQRRFRVWTVLLVVVPSLLIMAIYTVAQIKATKQEKLELLEQRVAAQKRMIENWMGERAGTVREVSLSEAFRNFDEEQMNRTLYFKQQNDANFDSLSYIDKDGYFTMTTLRGGIRNPLASDQPYYQAALSGNEYASGVVIGRNSGLPIINFSSPVHDNAGNFQGLILGSIRTTTLEALLRQNWMGQTGEILLVNRDGVFLTEPRHIGAVISKGLIREFQILNFTITDDARRNIRLGEAGAATWIDYQGERVLGAYQFMPEQEWTLIGKINETEVLAPVYNQLAMMAASTFFLVMLILPLAGLVINQIKRPMEWLVVQSGRVASGNYHLVGQEKFTGNMPREIENLCDTFVEMSRKIEWNVGLLKDNEAKLQSQVNKIQNINAALEIEVRERRAAEAALRQANQELSQRNKENKALLDAVPDLMFEIGSTGVILLTRGIRVKCYKPPEDQVGRTVFEVLPPEVARIIMDNIHTALTTNSIQTCEFNLVIDNQPFIREARIVSYKDDAALVVVRDITEERQAEQRMMEATRLVEQGQRLAALGVMAASLAHEINQPLNSVRISASGAAYTLRNKVKRTEEDIIKEFERITDEAERIDTIIQNIRLFVREDYSNRHLVDLKTNIEQAIRTIALHPLLQDTSVQVRVQEGISPVLANDVHLQQVVINLVMNAAQALAACQQSPKTIGIAAWEENRVILEVSDNGPGLPDDVKKSIFEPFVTTNSSPQSMGLGLSIVQTIIHAYGGKVSVCDNDSGGITFHIEFPPEDKET